MLKCLECSYRYASGGGITQFSADFQLGKMYGLLGPNGAGKSTLLKILSGNLTPSQGKVLIDDKNLHKLKQAEKITYVSYLPQTISCEFDYTCGQVVEFGRYGYSNFLPKKSDHEAYIRIMEEMNIKYLENRKVSQISGGEFQKIMIAQTAVQMAKIMIFDEAASHLDILCQNEILHYLKSNVKTKNIAVIISIHDISLAACYCDYLIFMKSGFKIAEGQTKEILSTSILSTVFGINSDIITYDGNKIPIVKKI